MKLELATVGRGREMAGSNSRVTVVGREDSTLRGKSGVEIAAELRRRKSATPASRARAKIAADLARRERDLAAAQRGAVTRK